MNGNRLAVLVVHDTSFDHETEAGILATNDLELCRIGNELYIDEWGMVLEVLANVRTVSPRPDLLLIDARFEVDGSAPELGKHGFSTKAGNTADPRGLLYGAMLAAKLIPSGLPFGFEIYSQDLASIAQDPYAQTFYGLLESLTDGERSPPDRGLLFGRRMEATPAGALPSAGLRTALKRFRKTFGAAVGRTITPNYQSFEDASEAVRQFVRHGTTLPEDLAVKWQVRDSGQTRSVFLRSLFADCRTEFGRSWDRAAITANGVERALKEIARSGGFLKSIEKKVLTLMTYTTPEETWIALKRKRKGTVGSGGLAT
jgi:hypothetical protein